MDSASLLLVIASAFGVFGEYMANQHASRIRQQITKLERFDFTDGNGQPAVWGNAENLRSTWDDLTATTPISAFGPVAALFGFLVLCVFGVAAHETAMLYGPLWKWQQASIDTIHHRLLLAGAVFLVGIACWLGWRLRQMRQKEKQLAQNAQSFATKYFAVKAGADAVAADRKDT